MANCRHGVRIPFSGGTLEGCTSTKQKSKPSKTGDGVKCARCNETGLYRNDARAAQQCPFHEKIQRLIFTKSSF